MKKILLLMFMLSVLATGASAQTVINPIQICTKKCSGEFAVRNDGITPVFVVLETRSTSFTMDGVQQIRPLDTGVTLQLSETSARLSPKSEHRFGYKLFCLQTPCAVAIYSSMAAGKTKEGMNLRVMIPTTVYFCSGGKPEACRESIRHKK